MPELFARDGEAAFRRAEADVLAAACAEPSPSVVSVAGGAVLSPDNRRLIAASGTVVWLRAQARDPGRPGGRRRRDGPCSVTTPPAAMVRLNEVRAPSTPRWRTSCIDVDDLPAEEVGRRILAAAADRDRPQRRPGQAGARRPSATE